jgi:hypothetical protein
MAETTTNGAKRQAAKPRGKAAPKQQESHACPVAFCPIGMALAAVQGAAPDVLEHLLAAAREFLLATKAVVDARGADFEEKQKPATLQKIEIG